ncbi:MAG: polysaccharide biosynthesis C-terminal domain-containing protein [Eubacterium sp.]|nr:polysaccharide biosynthesis C-terminal domain-containing protein [Eubacterium sp.]
MLSCAVQSLFQFLDAASVQLALGRLPASALAAFYPDAANVPDRDVATYVFGLFSAALDFRNLVPGITMALGICAVPAICREYEADNRKRLEALMSDIYRYTSFLSFFGGAVLALLSGDILSLFYSSSPDIARGCERLVFWFGVTVPLYSLASTAVFCVQAVGKPERSVVPYVISGAVRVILNIVLINRKDLILYGAVISGACGYFLIFALNARVADRTASVKFDVKNILLKPIFATFVAYFAAQKLYTYIDFVNSTVFNLLIKTAVFGAIYCILCFFVKMLNFKQIFCGSKNKKMA